MITEGLGETPEVTEEKTTADLLYAKEEQPGADDAEKPETQESKPSEDSKGGEVAEGDAKGDDQEKPEGLDKGDQETIEYDLKLSEGAFLDTAKIEEVTEFSKTHRLSNEVAQALLDRENQAIADYVTKAYDDNEAQINDWAEQTKSDPQIGGDNLNRTVENARRVVEKFGSEEFIKDLRETGYGNHPEVVRFLSKVGSLMEDDSLIMPGAHGEKTEKTAVELFYGKN